MNIFVFFILIGTLTSTHAGVTEEVMRFKKCYALFVRENPASSPLLAQVKSGSISGTAGCMQLLDKGTLGSDDEIQKVSGVHDEVGMKVLKTFNILHQSFFEMASYATLMDSAEYGTQDIIDANEQAYHLTYVLLKRNEQYKNIVTRNTTLKSIRKSDKSQRTKRVHDFGPMIFYSGNIHDGDSNNYRQWIPDFVTPTGKLVGITPLHDNNPAPTMPAPNNEYGGHDMNRHFGAGVIGTQSYLLANTAITFNESQRFSDGGIIVNRRWSKAVFGDLLCRPVPVLRNSDAVAEVNMNSNLPFRKGISCMGCHSSMDPMAGVLRNVMTLGTSRSDAGGHPAVRFFAKRDPSMGFIDHPVTDGNADYSKGLPDGRLRYRSFDGKLISEQVNDLDDLGEAIAAQEDLYACAAKRYFRFMTGITADLSDSGDINSPKLNQGDTEARNKVIQLGRELKAHQNLKQLLKSIIESDTFIHPSQGV